MSSKIRSSTLFNLNSNNKKPNLSKFQLFSHNKPAKVENNLKSFQTVFKQNFNNTFLNDSLTFNSYDECSRFVQCEAFLAASTKA